MSEPRVVVVGGGPAGLASAAAAVSAGAAVTLYEEGDAPGGQLRYRRIPINLRPNAPPEPPEKVRERLLDVIREGGGQVVTHALVWAIFADGTLAVAIDGAPDLVRPAAVVVATGSTDQPLPFGGWTLPGVFSARALLIAINLWGVLPGQRWALVGAGPERAEVTAAIVTAGGSVAIAVDPVLSTTIVVEGSGGVEAIRVGARRVPVDGIVVVAGRRPDATLPLMAGCEIRPNPAGDDHLPWVDRLGRSTVPRLWIAGDAAGICVTVEEALAEGRLVGLAAANEAGLAGKQDPERAASEAQPLLTARWAGQQLLAEQTLAPDSPASNPDRVITPPYSGVICRCEEICGEAIERTIAAGATTVNDVKRRTRAGMGWCQGIYCLPTVMAMLRASGTPEALALSPMTARPPVRPIPLATLAGLAERDD